MTCYIYVTVIFHYIYVTVTSGDDFVKTVHIVSGHSPSCVLYMDKQISDICRFCGADGSSKSSKTVLGIDRTFNLSSLYATVTVFKNLSVVCGNTQEAPIFLGPVMLHGDGHYSTYLRFLTDLRCALSTAVCSTELRTCEGLVVASDEEKVLVKVIRDSFPSAGIVFCSLHIKDNLRQHMKKIGVAQEQREKVISLVFGSDGLTSAADETTFESRVCSLLSFVRQSNVDIVAYLQERIIPKLLNNFTVISGNKNIAKHAWNNNNCESVNNLLKRSIDWKPARVMDLVDHIHDIVKLQYSDLRRSLFGQGNYQLAASFSRHYTPYARPIFFPE